jgi:hypothetical protein
MISHAREGARIPGSLRSADGKGIVRREDRLDTLVPIRTWRPTSARTAGDCRMRNGPDRGSAKPGGDER